MKKNESVDYVLEFHKFFGVHIGEGPNHIEPLDIRQLRIKLLFEELQELAEAGDVKRTFYDLCENHVEKVKDKYYDGLEVHIDQHQDGNDVSKVEELDAISDIQYVLDGKKVTSGLYPICDKALELVHVANMCKAHIDEPHAEETIQRRADGDGYVMEPKDGRIILLNSSGKVIKPHNHKKVDLSVLFQNQTA